jgi:DMSO/TMAO reductase YedYZ molybdopterin-dependent catalytic subunit
MKVKQVERVRKNKRPLIIALTSLLLVSIVTGIYWIIIQENPTTSTPYPVSTPTPIPTSMPTPFATPAHTPALTASPSPSESPIIDLNPKEIREYEGEFLSSINDFRENSIKGPQDVDINSYSLTIKGLVNESKEYTYYQVVDGFQKYQKVVTLNCVEGWSAKILWEGFLVKDLLYEAVANPEALVVIFRAYDDYSTALPIDYLLDNDILVAYKMNNETLPPERGFPFQLVAESKLGYKWIKWITEIEVSDKADYLGYWESRGYPNDANLP